MSAQRPASPELDPDDVANARYPNTARIWNYQLGGKDNYPVDREASHVANAMVQDIGAPTGEDAAQDGRHLLQRMVDYMLGQGVRQFLDLGSGFPNMANTHQVAHRVDPDARVVYVDIDPIVSTNAAALMAGPNVVALRADLREPEQVLGDERVRELLDFDQPVGIMFICMLHCLWDEEDPWGVVRRFRDAVVPGSYLAISHMTDEAHPQAAERLFQKSLDSGPDAFDKAWDHVYLGRLALAAGEKPAAAQHFQTALQLDGATAKARQEAQQGLEQTKQ